MHHTTECCTNLTLLTENTLQWKQKRSTNCDETRLLARFHSTSDGSTIWLQDAIMHVHWQQALQHHWWSNGDDMTRKLTGRLRLSSFRRWVRWKPQSSDWYTESTHWYTNIRSFNGRRARTTWISQYQHGILQHKMMKWRWKCWQL